MVRSLFDDDALLAELGVEIPWPEPKRKPVKEVGCGETAPKVVRHTEWSNAQSFEFEGYVARVAQVTCEHCGSMREVFEGVFSVERKIATGARRMQAMERGAQWPADGGHKCEVEQRFTLWCPECIRGLGFGREVEAEGHPRDMWKR